MTIFRILGFWQNPFLETLGTPKPFSCNYLNDIVQKIASDVVRKRKKQFFKFKTPAGNISDQYWANIDLFAKFEVRSN